MNSLPDYDVAVVGGGVSGIYSAWRLMAAHSLELLPITTMQS